MVKFLIIDDDEDDRDLFCDALSELDPTFLCLMATNGQEGLEHLRSGKLTKPDVIFLDLNMPRLNGAQTLSELKRDVRLQDIPVIMYTTSKLEEVKDETMTLGAAGFMTKPTSLRELITAIAKIVHEHLHIVSK